MARKRLQVHYSGRVQGVGFRYTVKWLAGGYEVTGAIKNLADGRVEMTAEGEREELEGFREAIRHSELGHFIRQEEVRWDDPKNEFHDFKIVY